MSVPHISFYTASTNSWIGEKCTGKDAKENGRAVIHGILPAFV
jgi:hypothetical protein